MNEHVLRRPQNRSNMQHPGLTNIATIGDILLRSLPFVKALTGFLTLHKQLSLAVMPIQDNEPVLQGQRIQLLQFGIRSCDDQAVERFSHTA